MGDLKEELLDGEHEISLSNGIKFTIASALNDQIVDKPTSQNKSATLKCPVCAKQCDDDAIVPLNCGHWSCYLCVCQGDAKKCQKCLTSFSKIWKFEQVSDEWKTELEEKV